MNLFTIAPGTPFLDELARWWLARSTDPIQQAQGLILLPTRRAARSLTDAFIRIADGRPLLLPRIGAVGALDEAPLAMAGVLDIPPAIEPMQRLATLTRLVMKLEGRFGAPATADRAWTLAAELARLLDEAHREGVDLASVLPTLAAEAYATHWGETLQFLQIVTNFWPQWLQDHGRVDTAARGVALLDAQTAHWQAAPPDYPVIVAGTAGGNAALARLMQTVSRLPQGMVVLPGLDLAMPDETWDALEPSHPQAGLRALLAAMAATRADVAPWTLGHEADPPQTGRTTLLNRALLPARALGAWREPMHPDVTGLERLEPADEQEEAVAIALVLREALERPGAQAALVTPDRALAGRVAAELSRYAVVVDDSAGEPLADTPPGTFLRLLVQAVADGLSPVALLATLKHPMTALGLPPAECRRLARRLELRVLRGPAPPPGLAGLRAALWKAGDDDGSLADLLGRVETRMGPLLALTSGGDVPPAAALIALIRAGESVADTNEEPGAARLWALEEGEAVAQHLAALAAALPVLPPQPVATLPGLLDASFEGAVVRSRRALRGRPGDEHPRVAILGLLEARLQSFDTLVLGGLAETVWPPATDPGPWMSRPMRQAAGLASPEETVGQMAHDFALLACAAAHTVLSCPRRRDGAPAVPARWLARIDAFLGGHGLALPHSPAAAWARLLDQPDGEPQPVDPPRPCPPVSHRPRTLGVTEVETLLRDPYGIYARHVLRLRALSPLEEPVENADYGNVVHNAIAAWVQGLPETYPTDAAERLRAEMDQALADQVLRPALVAWWRPRLHRIADWVAALEEERRLRAPAVVGVELNGIWTVPGITPPFTLRGRADRIERRPDGRLTVLDYKTGVVPKNRAVSGGYASQLPLEAAMVADGAFGPDIAGIVDELIYWRLTGGLIPGEVVPIGSAKEPVADLTDRARTGLAALVRRFDTPGQPYLSQPDPGQAPRFTDYAHLARVLEWSAGDDDDRGG